jgi:hypothetical protein
MGALEDIERLQRRHKRWVRLQALLGIAPVFAVANKIHPMVTDGYGGDLLPTLLPGWLGRHYLALLAVCLAALAASEILRRRFHARHKDDLEF